MNFYVAWNGENYEWPPPAGWHKATDGRWWAPETGPDVDLETGPDLDLDDPGVDLDPEWTTTEDFDVEVGVKADAELEPPSQRSNVDELLGLINEPPAVPSAHPTERIPALVGVGPERADRDVPAPTHRQAAVDRLRPHAEPTPNAFPTPERSNSVHYRPVPIERKRQPILTLIGDAVHRPNVVAVVAGLVGAAIVLVVAIAFSGDEPDAGAAPLQAGPTASVPALNPSATSQSLEPANTTMPARDDQSTDTTGASSPSTVAPASTVAVTDLNDPALLGRYRGLLAARQITTDNLSDSEIGLFAVSSCNYATAAETKAAYATSRDQLISSIANDELTTDELRFTVDAAIAVFCPSEANRINVNA